VCVEVQQRASVERGGVGACMHARMQAATPAQCPVCTVHARAQASMRTPCSCWPCGPAPHLLPALVLAVALPQRVRHLVRIQPAALPAPRALEVRLNAGDEQPVHNVGAAGGARGRAVAVRVARPALAALAVGGLLAAPHCVKPPPP